VAHLKGQVQFDVTLVEACKFCEDYESYLSLDRRAKVRIL
jgi:hypothetical protein